VTSEDARLAALRSEIERLDREIVDRVAERVRLAREIGSLKRDDARATLDPAREAAVIRTATEIGRQAGLEAEGVRELFWTLVGMCRRAQLEER
jgi:chorismate mutase